MRSWLIAGAICLASSSVHADEADDLVTQGEELAKQGEWTRAIDKFKAAEAKAPHAKQACLIGLAYTRRELWGQAEYHFARCRQRASERDPAPDWFADAEKALADKLAQVNVAAVTIEVLPNRAVSQIGVSSFAPDEVFEPRTIHLAFGTHVITASAPGYVTARQEIVVADNSPKLVSIRLAETAQSRVPLYVMIAGGALLAAGTIYDFSSVQPAREDLSNQNTAFGYYARLGDFETKRNVAVGLWVAGAATAVTGLVLRYTVYRHHEPPIRVGITSERGETVFSVGWSR